MSSHMEQNNFYQTQDNMDHMEHMEHMEHIGDSNTEMKESQVFVSGLQTALGNTLRDS